MEHLKRLTWMIALQFALSACGVKLDRVKGVQAVQATGGLNGTIALVDGTSLDLSKEKDPFVLIFAGYTCQSCREEAKAFANYFGQKGNAPKNVKIITVLVQATRERAEKFQKQTGAVGLMGFDESPEYFNSLCPTKLTPCTFTQNLKSSPTSHYYPESTTLDNLERDTGPWTY